MAYLREKSTICPVRTAWIKWYFLLTTWFRKHRHFVDHVIRSKSFKCLPSDYKPADRLKRSTCSRMPLHTAWNRVVCLVNLIKVRECRYTWQIHTRRLIKLRYGLQEYLRYIFILTFDHPRYPGVTHYILQILLLMRGLLEGGFSRFTTLNHLHTNIILPFSRFTTLNHLHTNIILPWFSIPLVLKCAAKILKICLQTII